MKIIFDNEEQKDRFFDDIITSCPFHYGINMNTKCEFFKYDCHKCWDNYVKMEIKNE